MYVYTYICVYPYSVKQSLVALSISPDNAVHIVATHMQIILAFQHASEWNAKNISCRYNQHVCKNARATRASVHASPRWRTCAHESL